MTLTNWYESGQKKSEGSCSDGKKNGLWTWWYENGNKELEKNYKDNKLDGVSTSWHESGEKRSEQNFKHGKMVGSYTAFETEIFEDSVDNRLRTITDFNGNFDYMTLREFAKKDYGLKDELDYGRQIIETPEHLSQYWWTYALMIARQWKIIYPCIKDKITSFIDVNGVEIIDYGCGQGGASLLFLDKFYSDFKKNISKIKLTDAGSLALQRAKMFLENYSSDIKKIIKYAEKEINNLGGKPEKWIEYPLVTNITDYNEIKRSMKEEGRLNEWVEWMLSNVEPSEKEHIGIKEILVWSYNDSVLRQAKLDCIEQDKEYNELLWNALNLDDKFVEHLKRQLKKEDVTVSRGVSTVKYFPEKSFHELVLRTMKQEGTNWNIVKRNLSKHTLEGEKIKIIEVSNQEGEMRPQIQLYTVDSVEPYKVMESTFKKKLTAYRKHLK